MIRAVPLLLLLMFSAHRSDAVLQCLVDDVTDGFAGNQVTSGNYNPATINFNDCLGSCGALGLYAAAVEDAQQCFCYDSTGHGSLTADLDCNAVCPLTGEQCGGDGGQVTSDTLLTGTDVAMTSAVSDLTLGADGKAVWSATGEILQTGVVLLLNAGDGSPDAIINGAIVPSTKTTFAAPLTFLVPGEYTIMVAAQFSPDNTLGSESQTIEVTTPPMIQEVVCPPLVRPGELYHCTATLLSAGSVPFTAIYSDDNVPSDVPDASLDWERVGRAAPQGLAGPSVVVTGGAILFNLRKPLAQRSRLTAIQWFGGDTGSCDVQVIAPSCATPGDVYCRGGGICSSECLDPVDGSVSCSAPSPVICSSSGSCAATATSASACGATSSPSLTTVTASVAISITAASYDNTVVAAEVWAERGDMLQVSCSSGNIAFTTVTPGEGDIDGISDDKLHLIEALLVPSAFLSFEHTCDSAPASLDFTLAHSTNSLSQTESTECQIAPGTISLQVEQAGAVLSPSVAPPPADTFFGEFVIDLSTPVTILTSISDGAPVLLHYSYGGGPIANATEEIGRRVLAADVFSQTPAVSQSGTHLLTVTASNLHSLLDGTSQATLQLVAQHPVLDDWQLVEAGDSSRLILADTGTVDTKFEMQLPSNLQLPTDAVLEISFGDGFPFRKTLLELGLEDSTPVSSAADGNFVAAFTNRYTAAGVYQIVANLSNVVSSITKTMTVVIIEEIMGLEVSILQQIDTRTADLEAGVDDGGEIYYSDQNLTFTLSLQQGTITVLEVYNETESGRSLLMTYTFNDMFNPMDEQFVYHINTAQTSNLTFIAKNEFEETSPMMISILILLPDGDISNFKIMEFDNVVTTNGEEKNLTIDFESSPSSMCLVVNYGDSSPLAAYGDEMLCAQNFSNVMYMPQPLTRPMTLSHTYWSKGMFNMSAIIYNSADSEEAQLMFLVTDFPCQRPVVTITGASPIYEEPTVYLKSQSIVVEATAKLVCDISLSTKKRWEIYQVDPTTGEELLPIYIMGTLPSWNKSDLLVPPNFLTAGVFKIVYTMTIHEPGDIPLDLPFQSQTFGFLELRRSPLIAGFLLGGVSEISRGWGQTISFDGDSFSFDNDAPTEKGFHYKWYCSRGNEGLPMDGTSYADDAPQSLDGRVSGSVLPGVDLGGCFGGGPGLLDSSGPMLTLRTDILQPYGSIADFRFRLVISKDTRSAEASVRLFMVSGQPPAAQIRCSDPLLCHIADGAVIVNKHNNLGLKAFCSESCGDSLTYSWSLGRIDNGVLTPLNNPLQYMSLPVDSNEIRISKDFMADYAEVDQFHVSLSLTNDVTGDIGTTAYRLLVNQPPTVLEDRCLCSPDPAAAVVDLVSVTCPPPVDPDGDGILKYTFTVELMDPATLITKEHIMPTKKTSATEIRLGVGTPTIYILAEDPRGGLTRARACRMAPTRLPNKAQMEEFMTSSDVIGSPGTGDSRSTAMLMSALESVRKSAPWLQPEGKSEEEQREIVIEMAAQNFAAIETISNMAVADKSSAALVASSVESTLSISVGDPLRLDTNTIKVAADVVSSLGKSMDVIDFATTEEMTNVMTSLGNVVGMMVNNLAVVVQDAKCDSVSEADLFHAPSFFYENVIDYDSETVIPDPMTQLKCNARDQVVASSKSLTQTLEVAIGQMQTAALRKMLVNEKVDISTESGLKMSMSIVSNTSNAAFTTGTAHAYLPSNFLTAASPVVAVALTEMSKNTKTTAKNADELSENSKVVYLDLRSRDLLPIKVSNIPEPVTLVIPRGSRTDVTPQALASVNVSDYLKDKFIPIVYTEFNISKSNSAFNIDIYTIDMNEAAILVFIDYDRMPTLQNYSHLFLLTQFNSISRPPPDDVAADAKYQLFVPSETVANRQGRSYVGVAELNTSSASYSQGIRAIQLGENIAGRYRPSELLLKNPRGNYKIRTYTSSCVFYDPIMDSWSGAGLKAVAADFSSTTCETNHLTAFSSGLFVQPNAIDFAYVFANAAFTDNMTIYMTLLLSFVIMLVMFVWARWQDKKDIERIGVRPLPCNRKSDNYLYEVIVFTGHKSNAATNSRVSFILVGNKDETATRTFGQPNRRFFQKSGHDGFVMSCPGPLGKLQYMKIWHDNSGRGRYASWFLQFMQIRDVQTGENFTFVCNNWLAVEEGDGHLDRLVPIAGKDQMQSFSNLFPHKSQEKLSDGHLWFSVFLRPPRSRFTRCQRVVSCFVLLYLAMMVNAMWYDAVPSKPSSGGMQFGPLSLSIEQISVGVMSNIITFVPSMLIIFLFRRARPRKLRQSRIDKAMQDLDNKRSGSNQPTDSSQTVEGKKGKKKTIAWWWKIVAWIVCIITLFGSVFIVWSYGIQFGNEKTTKWVSSLLVSFFSSIMLTQPIKVFLTAMVLSAIFKNIQLDSDDSNEDEMCPTLATDEEFEFKDLETHKSTAVFNPISDELRRKLRAQRLKEIQMWAIIREIFSYAFFLWILIILSYDNRDPNAFYLQRNLRNAFIKEGDLTGFSRSLDFSRVKDTKTFWIWAQNVIMPELRAQTWYNNITPAYGLRGFLDDRVNRIMGYGMMRQVRSKRDTCQIHSVLKSHFQGCQSYSSLINEETGSFCANWTVSGSRQDCGRVEYRYTTARSLDSLPFVGRQDVYGGGGYMFKMTGRQSTILQKMRQLERENWIDSATRAVFVEFAVYNAQVNLFGIGTMYVEVTPGGGMSPDWRFDGVRLTRHQTSASLFLVICESVYMIFIIYFIVREVRIIIKKKKAYFTQYSVYAEWTIIILSFVALIAYILRYIETNRILAIFKKTYGNHYIKLQYAQALDDLFGYIISIIVFIATLKFIKLLRFNKRIGMLSATLKGTWNDLTGFLLIFLIAIGSFSLLFNLLLVTSMYDFKDFVSALESCFAMTLGKFKFMQMYDGSFTSAVMFFIFGLYMNLILVNVLLTIIINGFEKVKKDLSKQPNDYEVVEFLVQRLRTFVGYGGNTVAPLKTLTGEHQQAAYSVDELPVKVNLLIDRINALHFRDNDKYKDTSSQPI